MTFDIHRAVRFSALPTPLIRQLFRAAGKTVDIPASFHFSIAVVSDATIKIANQRYRHKNTPTDVLSFRYSDVSGEILLSADRIRAQAQAFGHTVQVEAAFMLVHGILHILGWDHERSAREAREMRQLEHTILRLCGLAFAR
ncbi:MAG: rRNA maturation RNase YbeY [Candidatus Kerfeldbacteria bacterium]|nr:rRNA maturation RNase YbeY [Candidatus Kerfeldbacteria bacterium]